MIEYSIQVDTFLLTNRKEKWKKLTFQLKCCCKYRKICLQYCYVKNIVMSKVSCPIAWRPNVPRPKVSHPNISHPNNRRSNVSRPNIPHRNGGVQIAGSKRLRPNVSSWNGVVKRAAVKRWWPNILLWFSTVISYINVKQNKAVDLEKDKSSLETSVWWSLLWIIATQAHS